MRALKIRVFPEPGLANTNNAPSQWCAARRWTLLSFMRASSRLFGRVTAGNPVLKEIKAPNQGSWQFADTLEADFQAGELNSTCSFEVTRANAASSLLLEPRNQGCSPSDALAERSKESSGKYLASRMSAVRAWASIPSSRDMRAVDVANGLAPSLVARCQVTSFMNLWTDRPPE